MVWKAISNTYSKNWNSWKIVHFIFILVLQGKTFTGNSHLTDEICKNSCLVQVVCYYIVHRRLETWQNLTSLWAYKISCHLKLIKFSWFYALQGWSQSWQTFQWYVVISACEKERESLKCLKSIIGFYFGARLSNRITKR